MNPGAKGRRKTMGNWRTLSSIIPEIGYIKGSLLACTLGMLPATTIIPAAQAHEPFDDYSCYDLWKERNSIYADNGYCFKSEKAIAVFGRGCFPPYGHLKGLDKALVAEVESWEHRKGCR
jgi:YARHG domain